MVNFLRLYSVATGNSIPELETCYNIELTNKNLTEEDMKKLHDMLTYSGSFPVSSVSFLAEMVTEENVIEFGPNLTIMTPWATNVMSVIQKSELTFISRIEQSFRTSSEEIFKKSLIK